MSSGRPRGGCSGDARDLGRMGLCREGGGAAACAADRGVELAVLPETFVPLYPSNAWAKTAAEFDGWDLVWERLWANSVDAPGPLVDRLVETCRQRSLHRRRERKNKPKPLPPLATNRRQERLVRRGSTVRVRQRASTRVPQWST